MVTAILPVLAFSACLLVAYGYAERDRYLQQLMATTRATSQAIDADLARRDAILRVLQESPTLKSHDWRAFYDFAKASTDPGGSERIVLYEPSGGQLVSTMFPYGTPLPASGMRDVVMRVATTRTPSVSGLFIGTLSHEASLAVLRPVFEGGAVRYVLAYAFPPSDISRFLRNQVSPSGSINIVADRENKIIARTSNEAELLGHPVAPDLIEAIRDRSEGTFTSRRNIEGRESGGAFSRSGVSGWTVTFVVGRAILDAPLWRVLWLFGGGGVIILVGGLVLALYETWRITTPVRALATMAESMGRGEPLPAQHFDLMEAAVIADRLRVAAENIRTQADRVAERTEELQAVLDTAPSAIWIAHDPPECRRITGNAYADNVIMRVPRGGNISASALAAEAATHYKIYKNGHEIAPEEMPVQLAASTGRPVQADSDVDLVFEDGRTVSVLLSAAPLFSADGQVRGVVATGADVTALRRTEAALRQSEERLTFALRASEEGVWDWDTETDAVWYSSRWKEMLGYTEAEIEPHVSAWKRLLHPDDLERVLDVVQDVMRGERPYEVAFRMLHKDGHYVHILSRGNPVRRAQGGPIVRIVGTHLDLTSRDEADAALRASERRERARATELAAIMDTVPVAIFVSEDPEGRNITGNRTAYTLLRRAPGSNVSKSAPLNERPMNYRAMRNGSELPPEELPIQKAAFTGKPVIDAESDLLFDDGTVVSVLGYAAPILDEQGCSRGAVGAFLDVTARKQSEAALRESESRFRQLSDSLPQLTWACLPDGRCDYLSRQWIEYTGIPETEQLGSRWLDQVYPDDRTRLVAVWKASVETGEPFRIEVRIRRNDRAYRWFDTRANALRDLSGRITRWFGSSLDIEDSKQADEALRESEARYRNLFENMTEELHYWQLIRDEGGEIRGWRLVDANPPALKSWGKRIEDIRGKTADEIFGPSSSSHYMAAIQKITAEGAPYQFEDYFPNLRKHFQFTSIPLGDYFIITGFDITDIRKAQKLAEQRQAELEAANRELEGISYAMSHVLRAPLRAIDGYSAILLEMYAQSLDAECQRMLNVMRKNTMLMSHYLDDFLAFLRISRIPAQPELVDMEALVRSVVADKQAPGMARRDIAIEVGYLASTWGDRSLLERIWTNLLDNAIKFTASRQDARIEVGSKVADTETVYYVRDNGVGFAAEYTPKLFGLFERLHGEEFPGTGMGLAIVHRIVTRHGGRVWADSKEGEGTTIYFALPAMETQSSVPDHVPHTEEASVGGR